MLPAYAVAENPLDYTTIGVRQPGLIGETAADACWRTRTSATSCSRSPSAPRSRNATRPSTSCPRCAKPAKPAVLVLTGDNSPVEPFFLEAIRASGVPLFRSADRALRALRHVAAYGEALQRAARATAVRQPPAAASGHAFRPTASSRNTRASAGSPQAGLPRPAGRAREQSADDAVRIAATSATRS